MIHSVMWPAGRAYHTTCFVSPSLCVVMGGWVAGGHLDDDAYVIDIERGTAFRVSRQYVDINCEVIFCLC